MDEQLGEGIFRWARERFAENAINAIMVVLDPDVAKVFPNANSVNKAFRALSQIIQDRERTGGSPTKL